MIYPFVLPSRLTGELKSLDFHSFWFASVSINEWRQSPYIAGMTEIVSKQWDVFLFPFVHPPFSLVAFLPLGFFDTLETAALVHLWASVAALYLSAVLIARQNAGFLDFGGFGVLAIVVFLLGATLTRRVLLIGQLEWFVLALVLLAFEFRARAVVSGAFLSLAILLKAYAIVCLPLYLIGRYYGTIGVVLAVLAICAGLPFLLMFPEGLWSGWFAQMFGPDRIGAVFPMTNPINISLAGLLARLGFEGQLSLVFAVPAGLSLAVLILRDRDLTALHIANALCLIPLLPSVAWPQYCVYAFPATVFAASLALRSRNLLLLPAIAAAALLFFRYPLTSVFTFAQANVALPFAVLVVWAATFWFLLKRAGGDTGSFSARPARPLSRQDAAVELP